MNTLFAVVLALVACAYGAGVGTHCVATTGTSSYCGSQVPAKVCSFGTASIDVSGFTQAVFNAEVASFNATAACPLNPSKASAPTMADFCLATDACSADTDCKLPCYSTCTTCLTNSQCDALVALGTVQASGNSNCISSAAQITASLFVLVAVIFAFLF